MKKALITGVAGQDGSYLAEFLTEKGYEVHGVDRSDGDLLDPLFISNLVSKKFDEIYNLASVSTVQDPWEDPIGTVRSCGEVPLLFLQAVRSLSPKTRFFQASSAEMYGEPVESPQNEQTPFHPKKPYAYGKLLAHQAIEGYRKNHGIFAVSGILYNHESPRRHERFVTRKITSSLAKIKKGTLDCLTLGNLDTKRDWGFAGDYVRAMYLMLQAKAPNDYVIATGEVHTVREFVEAAAQALGMKLAWSGTGINEIGKTEDGRVIVKVSKEFYRPSEGKIFFGENNKIKKDLNWRPEVPFLQLVEMMVKADLEK
ncbi:hypothetical protein A2943_00110 [Candidatus Adlerbacteria bacterium RIFCSPLOWO2_01_FULL_51_16]|uniref:GDP-mannose 4,6-dehydratase n=1 Tax=Candidatus Adlerbacteria bacterium RIFCSPLOWO2_01_FULL_51_16 TaxID=1797243 RepID=A0A1F4XF83_9BACT|nr:MAG: hypothetical protein A2943_00110 [Candidatus Adlerbacteria bacterium RIFCSPLOWO2_01_FULL_51_16]